MAFRVRNTNAINFGVVTANTIVNHGRFRLASDNSAPVVIAFTGPVSAMAGRQLRIPPLGMQVIYNKGALTNDHLEAAVRPYWEDVPFEVDLMVDNTSVVGDSGYSQQATDAWTFDKPADV